MKRYAIVSGARSESEAAAYLPDNYRIVGSNPDADPSLPVFVIEGEDRAGWTLDAYVIPRYASGLIHCSETDLSDPLLKRVEVIS